MKQYPEVELELELELDLDLDVNDRMVDVIDGGSRTWDRLPAGFCRR